MNIDEDFVDYTGYDSPDYYEYSDEGVESDTSDEDSADGETQEEPGDNQRSKRKPGSELLGDIEGEWIDGKRTGNKVICRGALYTISKTSASGEFYQCYVILVERESTIQLANGKSEVNRIYLPIVHAFLSAADEETYVRFFKALREVLPELRPTRFKSDYERPAINAAKKVYEGIICEGDSFHFVQAVMKRVQKLGLMRRYREDSRMYYQVRLMITSMFVPSRHVEQYWSDVVKPMITSDELAPLVDYMEGTWIGRPATPTTRRRKPIFPPSLWNQYRRVEDQRPRHNNHMESNNEKLQALIKERPTVWDFLLGLRSAYKGDFSHLYQSWVRGEQVHRRSTDVARDREIYKQTLRWKDAEGARPRIRPSEWGKGMVTAMRSL